MANIYDVIVRPVITERSMATTESEEVHFRSSARRYQG